MAKDMVAVRRPELNRFAVEPQVRIGRSQFDRSHGNKLSFDSSYLYPILLDEVLPGDTVTCKLRGLVRVFSPLDAPIMDNISVETFYFFVPTRILWINWVNMQGEHDAAGAQDTAYTIPLMGSGLTVDHNNSGVAVANLAAYMGLPDGLVSGSVEISALPFRAYLKIYNEWFRDQNLTAERSVSNGAGPDTVGLFPILKSAKKHDYFTSCLPYLQKGTASSVALTGSLMVEMHLGTTGDLPQVWAQDAGSLRLLDADGADVDISASTSGALDYLYVKMAGGAGPAQQDATIDINVFRQALAIQRLLEIDARGGTRYVEIIKDQFGVTSPDFRLQRAEFLGGGKSFINISPIANTSSTAGEDQGELHAVGVGSVNGGFAKSFTEHGYIMGLVRARGDVTYFQGVDKLWTRSTRYDFYMPALAHLGEQAVLNKEIFVSNSAGTDDAVFGYQERWSEYRYKASKVTGLFNPDVSGALSHWHLAEDFASLPALNTAFIEDVTPMSRVTTVDTEHDFIADLWFDYKWARPIPVRSIPSIMAGRF